MSRFDNDNGTLLAAGAIGALVLAGTVGARGSAAGRPHPLVVPAPPAPKRRSIRTGRADPVRVDQIHGVPVAWNRYWPDRLRRYKPRGSRNRPWDFPDRPWRTPDAVDGSDATWWGPSEDPAEAESMVEVSEDDWAGVTRVRELTFVGGYEGFDDDVWSVQTTHLEADDWLDDAGQPVDTDARWAAAIGIAKIGYGSGVDEETWTDDEVKGRLPRRRRRSIRGDRNHRGSPAQLAGGVAHFWQERGYTVAQWPWWVSFTEGPPYRRRRYSVPMISRATANAWYEVYDAMESKKYLHLGREPSRNGLILMPQLRMPDGSPPPDIRRTIRRGR